MARILDQVITALPKRRQAHIEKRAEEIFTEYMILQQIRKSRNLTQKEMASALNISQDGVSRLETRTDVKISTLSKYIAATGGELKLVASYPDQPSVTITGFIEAVD